MIKKITLAILCLFVTFLTLQSQNRNEVYKALPIPYENNSGDEYGKSVAVDNDYAVIGSPGRETNKGSAYILHNNGTNWETLAILTASDGNSGDEFGCSVSIFGDCVVIGACNNESRGSAYVFEKPANGWTDMTETAKLIASEGFEGDNFGGSVGISEDVAIIGSQYNGDNGSAYIFEKPSTGWEDMTETAKLNASDGNNIYFGYSVNISSNNVIIGAHSKYTNYSGSAYVFEKPASGWTNMTETAKLTASVNASWKFGSSVNISDDIVVVGDNEGNNQKGLAYIFEKPITGWVNMTETAILTASDGEASYQFGYSTSIEGECIIIGAYGYNLDGGSVYIFEKPISGWGNMTETAKLTASDTNEFDKFGYAVSISNNHVLVGAYSNDDIGTNSGSIYTFEKPITGWNNSNEDQKLFPTIPYLNNANDIFGSSVAINGNYAIVGSPGWESGKGCAYILFNNGVNWERLALLTASDGVSGDDFGRSVSISGDYVVIGTYDRDAYVYEKPANGWENMTETAKLTASDGFDGDKFGFSVDISGNDIIVGAWGNGYFKGAAYIFEKPIEGWINMTETAKLTASDGDFYDWFGFSVSISVNCAVIGSYYDDDNGEASGSAYVFEKPANGWTNMTETAKLTASDGVSWDNFGMEVDIFENTIIIGTPNSNNTAYIFEKPVSGWTSMTETAILSPGTGGTFFGSSVSISNNYAIIGDSFGNINGYASGSVYIFSKPTNGWINMTETAKITSSDNDADDYFGCSVSFSDDNIIIGAYGNDDNGSASGSAYIFNNDFNSIKKLNSYNNYLVYPNPTNGIVNFEFRDNNIYWLRISDITGKQIIEKTEIQQNEQIDLSSFESGIYIISIQTEKEIFITKIIKR